MCAFKDLDELTKSLSNKNIKFLTLTKVKPDVLTNLMEVYPGYHAAITDSLNVEIGNIYSSHFDSRMCYLINKDRVVVDKFEIRNWKDCLKNDFEN
jgi:hypothetical protein